VGLKRVKYSSSQLCHSHIIGTSQRAQPSKIVPLLSSDFREFVASGMLTLKAKFETLDEPKIVGRAAEVWSFFWTQVLPVSLLSRLWLTSSTLKASSFPLLRYVTFRLVPTGLHLRQYRSDISCSLGSCFTYSYRLCLGCTT
jgi:hypothetical protein